VASLHARSPSRGTHTLLLLTKVVSLIVFTFLLAAGWVGVSYLKSDMASRSSNGDHIEKAAAPTKNAAVTAAFVEKKAPADTVRLSSPVHLVYSCKADKRNYHTSAHLPDNCERSALSEQSALQRGLKPCTSCLPH
jgi:hypothetical protein